MKFYAGIDLHSNNNYTGIIDKNNKKHFGKRLPNSLHQLLSVFEPFKDNLVGVVVESTYNWYWLVDGLMENGYTVHLANPSAIKQYEGLKYSDDKSDAFWLAHLLNLGILKEGYIYPKESRPLRDMLRRRSFFVQQRTSNILSFQSMVERNLGNRMSGRKLKALTAANVEDIFSNPELSFTAQRYVSVISNLSEQIKAIEKRVKPKLKLTDSFPFLQTVPGIGDILAFTIMLEVGDIRRFKSVGNYSSYCRCVGSERFSNKKKKAEGNRKNGNRYLSWAYVEAAHFCSRFCKPAQSFYQKKKAKANGAVATKALSHKLARATYYIMRDGVQFDENMLFP